ncbi:MAG: HIT family protein [Salinisphaera sp.]|nr:HIT family protein [Salinisphaera sp.]
MTPPVRIAPIVLYPEPTPMDINEQLLADCHMLGSLERASVLLHRNASVGWLILVVDTAAIDWHQLDDDEHARVAAQVRALSRFVANEFEADKLNVATLGNQVAQMHIHIIARHRNDPCWPRPVWGNLDQSSDYSATMIATLRDRLVGELGLETAGLA